MIYVHDGKKQVIIKNNPIDPNSIDWAFFIYDGWLRPDESITGHSGIVEGGEIDTDSTFIGNFTDLDDKTEHVYTHVYGVKHSVTPGAVAVIVTHRKSTTVAGAVNTGRTDIDHTMVIPVRPL